MILTGTASSGLEEIERRVLLATEEEDAGMHRVLLQGRRGGRTPRRGHAARQRCRQVSHLTGTIPPSLSLLLQLLDLYTISKYVVRITLFKHSLPSLYQ